MSNTNAYPDMQRTLEYIPVKNTHPQKLTIEQIQYFNENGFIFPLDVFTGGEAESNRDYFDELMLSAENKGHNSYSINGWHRSCVGIYDLVTDHRILDYVQDLLGKDLICWGSHFFCKMPGDSKQVSWHQDASYWPLTPSKTITVWLAIDDANIENGAMEVIPGSHLDGQIPFEDSKPKEENVLNQSVQNFEGLDALVPFEMKAGQISLHTDLLLHGSKPNKSVYRRCGLTMRFVSPEVRAAKGWNKNSIICRGNDFSGHWQNNPPPKSNTIPERS